MIKAALLMALVGHILCGISDCLLGYSRSGRLDLKNVRDPAKMAEMFRDMPLSFPMISMILGTFSILLFGFGYIALSYWMQSFSVVAANILFISSLCFLIPIMTHHVFCGAVEWIYIRLGRKNEVRSAVLEMQKKTISTMFVGYAGLLVFLMTLFFTAMVAVNFCNLALPGAMDPKVSNAYYNLSNLDSSLEGVLGSSNGFATQLITELAKQIVSMAVNVNGIIQQLGTSVQLSILLIFAVPNALFALALWIMLIQTKRDRSKFGLGGYTLARVMMVLKFVVACLVLAVGLIISVYFVVVGASSARFTSSFIQGLIMLIIMIFIAIFTIMYYIQWMYTLKCVKVNVRSGSDIGRVPTYVGILSIILAVFFALMLLPLAPNDYLGLAAGGTKALYFLVSGIWLLKYHIESMLDIQEVYVTVI